MSISAIKDNALLLDQIKYVSHLINANSKDKEQKDSSNDLNLSSKNTTPDQKSAVVADKVSEQTPFVAYNLGLRPEAPVSKSGKPERTYNDTKKKQTVEVEDQETGEFLDSELIDDEKVKEDPKGKGFYINPGSLSVSNKPTKSIAELFQEKLNHIYNIGFTREPGTLVNLVF